MFTYGAKKLTPAHVKMAIDAVHPALYPAI